MDLRGHYLNLVEYEKWANNLWLDFFDSAVLLQNGGQFIARSDEWMTHIIGCYLSWFDALTGDSTELTGDHRQDLMNQAERMSKFIKTCDFEEVRQRSWPEYGTYEWRTGQIIYHALSHGMYHRGHIRAIAEELGLTDWPDTDFCDFTGIKISS